MKKWTWKACGKHSYIDATGALSVMNLLVGYANAKAKETLRQGDDRLPRFGVQLARIRMTQAKLGPRPPRNGLGFGIDTSMTEVSCCATTGTQDPSSTSLSGSRHIGVFVAGLEVFVAAAQDWQCSRDGVRAWPWIDGVSTWPFV